MSYYRKSKLETTVGWVQGVLSLLILEVLFGTTMIVLVLLSLPIWLLWNGCWVEAFPIFHSMGYLTCLGCLVMVRLIISGVK